MPKLIRFYIQNVLIGFAIAAVFVAVLLGFNVANLGHLILGSSDGLLAAGILWFANGIVFAGVQFAIAVMGLKEDEPKPKGGLGVPLPLSVRQRAPVRISPKGQGSARK
ncbi:MAG: hypothetical protein JXR13_12450 [Thalassovita sp.]